MMKTNNMQIMSLKIKYMCYVFELKEVNCTLI